jgi:hypothetical protein
MKRVFYSLVILCLGIIDFAGAAPDSHTDTLEVKGRQRLDPRLVRESAESVGKHLGHCA